MIASGLITKGSGSGFGLMLDKYAAPGLAEVIESLEGFIWPVDAELRRWVRCGFTTSVKPSLVNRDGFGGRDLSSITRVHQSQTFFGYADLWARLKRICLFLVLLSCHFRVNLLSQT